MSEKQWLDTFEIQHRSLVRGGEAKAHIYCFNCDTRHWSIWNADFSCTREAPTLLAQSWKPITLECSCGARCTILNGRICE